MRENCVHAAKQMHAFIRGTRRIHPPPSRVDENDSSKICNSITSKHNEFLNISKRLQRNGYPKKVINNTITKFSNKKPNQDVNDDIEPPPKLVFTKLPFLGDAAYHLEKEIGTFLDTKVQNNFKFILTHTTSPIKNFFRYKDRQQLLHSAGVVYELKCSCGQKYIGQTRRNLITRLKEHNPAKNGSSDVADHLYSNPNHSIDFKNPKILAKDEYLNKLLIKETLLIQQTNPQLNTDKFSHPLYLFNT